MQIPLQITFRNLEGTPAMETDIRERVAKLEQFFDRISSCRVMVEAPHRRHHQGKLFHVRIDMTLPGGTELVVNRDPKDHQAHEDIYVALRDAFKALKRQLQDFVRRNYQHHTKSHEPYGATAWVSRIFPMEDYGFLKTKNGEEIYFHRNSVSQEAFDRLDVGSKVLFVAEMGEKGPQASNVRLLE